MPSETPWFKTKFLEEYISKTNVNRYETILEIGSKDCNEALTFTKLFPNAHIYSFECNPRLIPLCRANSAKSDRITLIEKCVTDNPDNHTFYLPKPHVQYGEGVASFCKPWYDSQTVEVDTIRIDQFLTNQTVDLVWIDVQGAECQVLNSFGSKLNQVNTIYCEVNVFHKRYDSFSDEPTLIKQLNSFSLSDRLLLNPNEAHLILNKK
mgnify:CR=1 FL=1